MNSRTFLGMVLPFLVACGSIAPQPSSIDLAAYPRQVTTAVGLVLRLIPPGEFAMGAHDGPANERPVHEVRITYPFFMGETEVTQRQFDMFVEQTGYVTAAERSGGAKVWRDGQWIIDPAANFRNVFPGSKRPVVAVSFDDAIAFCAWLTQKERRANTISSSAQIRLPTEAEWEYAARAGGRSYWSGAQTERALCRYANVPDESAHRAGLGRSYIACADGVALETAEVGRYLPNAFGLYDMSGNVWEWTQDRMGVFPSGKTIDPEGPLVGEERVVRGGSWSGNLHGLRVSHRDGYSTDLRGGAIGFRVVLVDPQGNIGKSLNQ